MTSYPPPMCISCTRYDPERPGMYCTSFPEGIPEEIVESRFDHRISLGGEPTFEQAEGQPEPDWEMVDASATLRTRVHGVAPPGD